MTTIKLACSELDSALNKAMKCTLKEAAKFDPRTVMVQLTLEDGVLSFRTTDTQTVLIVRILGVEGENFSVVTEIKEFAKILSKQTVDEITLTVTDKVVELRGNGVYKLDVQMEGEGKLIFDPVPLITNPEIDKEFPLRDLVDVINVGGKFISAGYASPEVCGYYFSDYVITTDNVVASFYKKRLFDDAFLLFESTFSLLSSMEGDTVRFLKRGEDIQFVGETFLISSKLHPDTNSYPEGILKEYLAEDYKGSVIVDVKTLSSAIDRVDVFASTLIVSGKGSGVVLDFQPDAIQLSDKKEKAVEYVPYINKVNYTDFQCKVSCIDFINAITLDGVSEVELRYGNGAAIEIVARDVTRVLGFLEDEDDLEDEIYSGMQEAEAAFDDLEEDLFGSEADEDAIGISDSLEDLTWIR